MYNISHTNLTKCQAWWTFRPRKKKFSPPAPKIPQFAADTLLAPRPLSLPPPPLLGFSIKNDTPPLLAPRTPPFPLPEQQKIKNIRNVYQASFAFGNVGTPTMPAPAGHSRTQFYVIVLNSPSHSSMCRGNFQRFIESISNQGSYFQHSCCRGQITSPLQPPPPPNLFPPRRMLPSPPSRPLLPPTENANGR